MHLQRADAASGLALRFNKHILIVTMLLPLPPLATKIAAALHKLVTGKSVVPSQKDLKLQVQKKKKKSPKVWGPLLCVLADLSNNKVR